MEVRIDGFEDLLRRVVREEIQAAEDGFLDVIGAADYLSTTPKAIYRAGRRAAAHRRD